MDVFGLNHVNGVLDARLDVLHFEVGIVVSVMASNGMPSRTSSRTFWTVLAFLPRVRFLL